MAARERRAIRNHRCLTRLIGGAIHVLYILMLVSLGGCSPWGESMLADVDSPPDATLEAVDYAPLPAANWQVSVPEEQQLDPWLIASLYYRTSELETIYSLLVIRNGKLVAERYFLAWGYGGQLIVLADELDMVVVETADPLYGETGDGPWRHEKANNNLVAEFITSLLTEGGCW